MATPSGILTWKIPIQGSEKRGEHDSVTRQQHHLRFLKCTRKQQWYIPYMLVVRLSRLKHVQND